MKYLRSLSRVVRRACSRAALATPRWSRAVSTRTTGRRYEVRRSFSVRTPHRAPPRGPLANCFHRPFHRSGTPRAGCTPRRLRLARPPQLSPGRRRRSGTLPRCSRRAGIAVRVDFVATKWPSNRYSPIGNVRIVGRWLWRGTSVDRLPCLSPEHLLASQRHHTRRIDLCPVRSDGFQRSRSSRLCISTRSVCCKRSCWPVTGCIGGQLQ